MIAERDAGEIAAAFDLGAVRSMRGPVARGVVGQIWRLTTDVAVWAVKESFRIDPDEHPDETAAFQEAAGRKGVPVPTLRRTGRGSPTATIGGNLVRVYEFVDLREPDIGLDVDRVGSTLAAIHRVGFEGRAPTHPWNFEPVGASRWDGLIDDLRVAGAQLADDFARWRNEFVALEGWLAEPRALQTCHRDLWADNLRQTTAGGLCVIDWDNAGLADPNQELAMVLFEFGAGEPDRARGLAAAYIAAGGPARVRDRGDFSMTIAQLGHIAEHIGREWLAADATGPARDRAGQRFAEYDSHPFTRDVIDELLDAVT